MAKHLLIDDGNTNWRLSVSEYAETLDQRWRTAFDAGTSLEVRVVLGDGLEERTLWVNPRAVGWYIVIDRPDPDQ
jgi:hypothetical protein